MLIYTYRSRSIFHNIGYKSSITDWLIDNGHNTDFETLPAKDLDCLLAQFYASIQPVKGDKPYSKSTYTNVRAAINRHVRLPPHNRQINVMKDREFQRSNQVIVNNNNNNIK